MTLWNISNTVTIDFTTRHFLKSAKHAAARKGGHMRNLGWINVSFIIDMLFISRIYWEVKSEVIEQTNKG